MAMELWGKWFYHDIDAHLSMSSARKSNAPLLDKGAMKGAIGTGTASSTDIGFQAHSWLRVCGVACSVHQCTLKAKPTLPRALQSCHDWLMKARASQADRIPRAQAYYACAIHCCPARADSRVADAMVFSSTVIWPPAY